jgi:hypothetical protein
VLPGVPVFWLGLGFATSAACDGLQADSNPHSATPRVASLKPRSSLAEQATARDDENVWLKYGMGKPVGA